MNPIPSVPQSPTLALAFVALSVVGCEPPVPRQGPMSSDTGAAADVPRADAPAEELDTVLVHFTREERPYAIERVVPRTPAVLQAALEQQLAGPTPEERRVLGLSSFFSDETEGMLRSVTVDVEGHAVVDFGDFSGVVPNASSSLGSALLLGELNATVFQFPTVRSLEYRFEGSCDAFANWLQLSCERIGRGDVTGRPSPPNRGAQLRTRSTPGDLARPSASIRPSFGAGPTA